jgi:hypothetical protein
MGRSPTSGRKRNWDERRASERYEVDEVRAHLVWGEGGRDRASVAILNVSLGGALLITDETPMPVDPVWLWCGLRGESHWAELEVLARQKAPMGMMMLRVRFLETCPYELFKLAAFKTELQARPDCVSPEFESRLWR